MKTDRIRSEKLIRECIDRFALDLSGLVVLTEAAGGNFMSTPIIAALAGAREVIAVTRDSPWGKAKDIIADTVSWAEGLGLSNICTEIGISAQAWSRADIITNLGFVRPINRAAVDAMKPTAAVSLMWEPWEFRREDIDIDACREKGILVMGTDEGHPSLDFRRYVGLLCVKLLFEAGIEVNGCKILVASSGRFAKAIGQVLSAAGAQTAIVSPRETDCDGVQFIPSSLDGKECIERLARSDALVVAEHSHRDRLLAGSGSEWAGRIARLNPSIRVVHLCGRLDRKPLTEAGISITPAREPAPGFMSVTTDYLGPRPVIELHAAGLKVGEAVARARIKGLSVKEAAKAAALVSPAAPLL